MAAEGPLVLLVEDERPMRRYLRAALGAQHYRVLEAGSCREAIELATAHNPEVLLLDLGLPDGDGLDLIRTLRGWSVVPIVVLSGRAAPSDQIAALDAGADDYLAKPFSENELLARLRVALRHAQHGPAASGPATLEVDELRIDTERRLVTKAGRLLHLTPIEYRLLVLLAQHLGRVLTHHQLQDEVWGPASGVKAHSVRMVVAELRKKLEDDPARPRWLITEQGVGYRLREGQR